MARYYDDIYFTSCNGSLRLHLDDPTGVNESDVYSSAGATYFRVEIINGSSVYPSGYSGNGCETWVTSLDYEYSDQFQLNDSSNLDLVLDFNDSGASLEVDYATTSSSGTITNTGGHSECFENNWWKDGRRAANAASVLGMKIRLNYYNSSDGNVAQQIIGTNQTSSRVAGQAYIYNSPSGTSRALIDDDGTSRPSTDYGVTSTPFESMSTSANCSGDPHVSTFDGRNYNL